MILYVDVKSSYNLKQSYLNSCNIRSCMYYNILYYKIE